MGLGKSRQAQVFIQLCVNYNHPHPLQHPTYSQCVAGKEDTKSPSSKSSSSGKSIINKIGLVLNVLKSGKAKERGTYFVDMTDWKGTFCCLKGWIGILKMNRGPWVAQSVKQHLS